MTVQLKFEEGYNGLYFIGENVVDLGKDGIWTTELTGDAVLDSEELDIKPAVEVGKENNGNPIYGKVLGDGKISVTVDKGENAGNYFKYSDDKNDYAKYGDYVTVNEEDAKIEVGYIQVTIKGDNPDGSDGIQYQKANEEHYSQLDGTGTGYKLSKDGGETWTYVEGNKLSATDAATDVIIDKGYVVFTFGIDADKANKIEAIEEADKVQYFKAGEEATVTVTVTNKNLSDGNYTLTLYWEGNETGKKVGEYNTTSTQPMDKEFTFEISNTSSDRDFTLKLA